jgi:hypothetical protein
VQAVVPGEINETQGCLIKVKGPEVSIPTIVTETDAATIVDDSDDEEKPESNVDEGHSESQVEGNSDPIPQETTEKKKRVVKKRDT